MSQFNDNDFEYILDCTDLSEDSEYSDEEVSEPHNANLVRESRSPRSNHRGGSRGNRGAGRSSTGRRRNRAVATTSILMPTDKVENITDLVEPKWRCGQKTKLITLKTNHREYKLVEKQMKDTIAEDSTCKITGGCFDTYDIVKIQKILQGCAWRRYILRKKDIGILSGVENERMLFHGSDAVWDIVSAGFDERFASTNGSFGAGLYFTQNSSVSNKFVFGYFGGKGCDKHQDKNCYICERRMLLCRVTLGKEHKVDTLQNMAHPPPGFDSVIAVPSKMGFEDPEYVIYRGDQAYPEFLITYKVVKKETPEPKHQDKPTRERDGPSTVSDSAKTYRPGSSKYHNRQ